jgi:hypothetical protein
MIRLVRMYIPLNWEFGSALAKLRNFGGSLTPQPPHPPYANVMKNADCHLECMLCVY